ncbi:MAG: phospholipid transport system transporter-binding protein [Cocleimonas sp.]|jgi:phospholipid transport system transporter-binding protein
MTTTIASKVEKREKGMTVSGSLVFANITSLLEKGCELIRQHQGGSFVIDCSAVKRIDSAGIALLLEWQRQSQSRNKNAVCRFVELSSQAQSLIQAYRLQSIISA